LSATRISADKPSRSMAAFALLMQTSSVAASFKQGITTDSSIPEAEFAATRAVSLVNVPFAFRCSWHELCRPPTRSTSHLGFWPQCVQIHLNFAPSTESYHTASAPCPHTFQQFPLMHGATLLSRPRGFPQLPQGVWKATKKCFVKGLTYSRCLVRLQMARCSQSVGSCRGFTVGSEVIQGTDPIVRRLISTG